MDPEGISQQAPAMKYKFSANTLFVIEAEYVPRIPKEWIKMGNPKEGIWVWSCSIGTHIEQREANLAERDW